MTTVQNHQHYDVVVVGARCSGSPLATILKRSGLSVCVVDQTEFPSDTLSTHMFQIGGIEVLQRLGVLDKVLATGAPPITSCYMKFEDVDLSGPPRLRQGDVKVPLLCVRRIALDVRLVECALEAGVEMRLRTRVTGCCARVTASREYKLPAPAASPPQSQPIWLSAPTGACPRSRAWWDRGGIT